MNNVVEAIKQGNLEQVKTLLQNNPALINQYDETGATPLHYAAFHSQQLIVKFLVENGAEINSRDTAFGATPTGWAIEYLRELGGHLAIELEDLSYAIQQGDVKWTARFLQRFPELKKDRRFIQLAHESGNAAIIDLFYPPQ